MSPSPIGPPWQAAVDPRLLRRLLSRRRQPGVVDVGLAAALVARLESAARSLPLLAHLAQRYGETALQAAEVPIVYAQLLDERDHQIAEPGRPPRGSPERREDGLTVIVHARAAAPHERGADGAASASPPPGVVSRLPDRAPAVGGPGPTSGAPGGWPVAQRPVTVAGRYRDGAHIGEGQRIDADHVTVVPEASTRPRPDGSRASIAPLGFDQSHPTGGSHLDAIALVTSIARQEQSTPPADPSRPRPVVAPTHRRPEGSRAVAGVEQLSADRPVVVETRDIVTSRTPDSLVLAQGPPLAPPAGPGRAATAAPASPFSGRGDRARPAEQAAEARVPRGARQGSGAYGRPSSSSRATPDEGPLSPPPPASPRPPRILSERKGAERPELDIDMEDLVERVQRRLRRRLSIERERKGWVPWT